MKTILVAFDFSDLANAALECAATLAPALGAGVRVLHVLPVPPLPAFAPIAMSPPSPDQLSDMERQIREAGLRHGLAVDIEIVTDAEIGGAIVRAADRCDAALIAIGTRGLGGVARAVLGSVADIVVRTANCPVVTVRIPYVDTSTHAPQDDKSPAPAAGHTR